MHFEKGREHTQIIEDLSSVSYTRPRSKRNTTHETIRSNSNSLCLQLFICYKIEVYHQGIRKDWRDQSLSRDRQDFRKRTRVLQMKFIGRRLMNTSRTENCSQVGAYAAQAALTEHLLSARHCDHRELGWINAELKYNPCHQRSCESNRGQLS